MYQPLLFIHSWTRWVVLLAAIYFLVRSAYAWRRQHHWSPREGHFIWAFNQVFGYQVLFGLTLWMGVSPLTRTAFQNRALLLESGVLTFWAILHPLTMLLALGVFHMGKGRARRVPPTQRFKVFTLTFAAVLLMIASAIPWPWMAHGRSLFRWFQ